jgi:hypothetical protein
MASRREPREEVMTDCSGLAFDLAAEQGPAIKALRGPVL